MNAAVLENVDGRALAERGYAHKHEVGMGHAANTFTLKIIGRGF